MARSKTTPRTRMPVTTDMMDALSIGPDGKETPWAGDPTKKIGINLPFPEPMMRQMDWLLEENAIRSKSSFIREAVAKAAAQEVERVLRTKEAVRLMDEREGSDT